MDHESKELIEKLFLESIASHKGIKAKNFRAQNHQYLDLLDSLENNQYIEQFEENYYVKLIPVFELSQTNKKAEHILFLCELLFKSLHSYYLKRPGESINLNDLALKADIPRSDVNKALSYIVQSHILGGYTTKFYAKEEASVTPGERILRFNSFKEVVEDIIKMQKPAIENSEVIFSTFQEQNSFEVHQYINQERIIGLEGLQSDKFDFSRMIGICNEINSCSKNGNYLAVGALVRMLLDHVPPIFGLNSFKEVASNYKSGKSLKASLKNLENSSRNISDGILHQVIRRKETLPNLHQVNFSPDIDVLIGEVIRITKEHA